MCGQANCVLAVFLMCVNMGGKLQHIFAKFTKKGGMLCKLCFVHNLSCIVSKIEETIFVLTGQIILIKCIEGHREIVILVFMEYSGSYKRSGHRQTKLSPLHLVNKQHIGHNFT